MGLPGLCGVSCSVKDVAISRPGTAGVRLRAKMLTMCLTRRWHW